MQEYCSTVRFALAYENDVLNGDVHITLCEMLKTVVKTPGSFTGFQSTGLPLFLKIWKTEKCEGISQLSRKCHGKNLANENCPLHVSV